MRALQTPEGTELLDCDRTASRPQAAVVTVRPMRVPADCVPDPEVPDCGNVFVSVQNRLALLRDERGQTMAEYGVVLAVIAVIVVTALTALSGGITGALDNVRGVLGG